MTNSQELFRRSAAIYREAVLLRHKELSKAVVSVAKGYVKAACEQDLVSAKTQVQFHNYGAADGYLDHIQALLERNGYLS